MPKYHQGFFRPKNPQKYKGDPNRIVYRSGWELSVFVHLDKHPDVVQWASEEIVVPYTNPFDQNLHRYFPDLLVWIRQKDGSIKTFMYEIKPQSQSKPPKVIEGKKNKKYLNEVYTWGINQAKWNAARYFCAKRGWEFKVLTEKDLGLA